MKSVRERGIGRRQRVSLACMHQPRQRRADQHRSGPSAMTPAANKLKSRAVRLQVRERKRHRGEARPTARSSSRSSRSRSVDEGQNHQKPRVAVAARAANPPITGNSSAASTGPAFGNALVIDGRALAKRDPDGEDRRHRQDQPDRKEIKVGRLACSRVTQRASSIAKPQAPSLRRCCPAATPNGVQSTESAAQAERGQPEQRRLETSAPPRSRAREIIGRIEQGAKAKQRDADRKQDENRKRVQRRRRRARRARERRNPGAKGTRTHPRRRLSAPTLKSKPCRQCL